MILFYVKDFLKNDQVLLFSKSKILKLPRTYLSYPKYCDSKLRRKNYALKLERNGIIRLAGYLDMKKKVMLHFLR